MSLLWAFVEDLRETGSRPLSADEARHVAARRLRMGDELVLFDGAGHFAEARIEAIGKRSVEVSCETIEQAPAPERTCAIASAIPKGDRLSTMLQMLTQLGVEVWQPLVLDDSVVRTLDPDSKRLRRILVEAAKLARRPWLLSIAEPCSLDSVIEARGAFGRIFFGDRDGGADGLDASAGLVVIGPEAGLRENERERLRRAGAVACSFAPHNLRIETAAVAAAVAVNLARGESSTCSDEGGVPSAREMGGFDVDG